MLKTCNLLKLVLGEYKLNLNNVLYIFFKFSNSMTVTWTSILWQLKYPFLFKSFQKLYGNPVIKH